MKAGFYWARNRRVGLVVVEVLTNGRIQFTGGGDEYDLHEFEAYNKMIGEVMEPEAVEALKVQHDKDAQSIADLQDRLLSAHQDITQWIDRDNERNKTAEYVNGQLINAQMIAQGAKDLLDMETIKLAEANAIAMALRLQIAALKSSTNYRSRLETNGFIDLLTNAVYDGINSGEFNCWESVQETVEKLLIDNEDRAK